MVPSGMILLSFRPEGPAVNRPGHKAGIGIAERWSAEGAALFGEVSLTNMTRNMSSIECRAFGAHFCAIPIPA